MKRITTLLLLAVVLAGAFISPAPALANEGTQNFPLNSIVIKVEDIVTHRMLAGARFEIFFVNEAVSGGSGTLIATVDSDSSGVIVLSGLPSGYYIVRQTVPPNNYQLSINNEQHAFLRPDGTSIVELTFSNYRYGGLVVLLNNRATGEPIAGASFSVTDVNGATVGHTADGIYTTDSRGQFYLENLPAGDYRITQLTAAQGYAMDASPLTRTVRLQHTSADQSMFMAAFENSPLGSLMVTLRDSHTREPLSGGVFNVRLSGGADMGDFTTGADGSFTLPRIARGSYIISQITAPNGYLLDNTARTQYVNFVDTFTVNFENSGLASLQIIKVDEFNGEPLAGAHFRITTQGGEFVADVVTDAGGRASIPSLEPGWYVVTETRAPAGYLITEPARTVEIRANVPTVITVTNRAENNLQILKLDYFTRAPLAGATFRVEHANGENAGTFITDSTGQALVGNLREGTYIISELRAPDGYILDNTPQTIVIQGGRLHSVEFLNKPMAGLQIIKVDRDTRQPIPGVMFSVSRMNGERIGEFTTGADGTIFLSELEPGWYTVVETRAAEGYIIDSQPRNVEIRHGAPVTLTVENVAMSGLLIVKTDEATGNPIPGVVFEVRRADGRMAGGLISDGNQPNTEANSPNRTAGLTGMFTTDRDGRIQINTLPPGEYHVVERRAAEGYVLDETVHSVTVTPGRLAALEVTNRQMGGLRLLKIDSVTRQPIFGVEFMVFDMSNRNVGTFITDNNGLIDFSGILSEGRYVIRETRPADGYYRDDMPRTVEFTSGRITEIVWENTPQMGQIQILKLSGDDNEVNGLPAGTPLAGAVFEVYHHRTGNLVDRFVSGTDGRAVSRPLPIGRYIVREVEAPQWYRLSTETLDIEIEFATQIIRREFLNYSANTGVRIRKTGNHEAMSGNTIRYGIREIQNTSSVPLADFYWRDVIPTSAVRLERVVTGTYNQSLRYKVLATTNRGDTRVVADNLSTLENNVIDFRRAALGLGNDEYITDFTLVFGTVRAGFTQVTAPQVFVTVNQNLPNGYEFANRVDIGGKHGNEWIIGSSTWVTTIFAPPSRLPRTGF